jgi:Spy/CpxP family protein refolding chaperone
MNKKILFLSLAMTLPVTAFAVSGQGHAESWHHHGRGVEQLSKALELTKDQQAKLEGIFSQQREKIQALHEESQAAIKQVLTTQQLARWEELQQHHGEQRHK